MAESEDDFRRLFIDIAAQSQTERVTFIEVKALEQSAVHAFMELVGQYVVSGEWRRALSQQLAPARSAYRADDA